MNFYFNYAGDIFVICISSLFQNRMWRKNRAPSFALNPFCRGTDPNRNFDASFGGT